MLHWSVPRPEQAADDILEIAREAAASVADSRLRWQYLEVHCDHFGIVQACVTAIKADREARLPTTDGAMQEGDPIGWIEHG
jgi:hypothetical protein